jgi:hypothetical protein
MTHHNVTYVKDFEEAGHEVCTPEANLGAALAEVGHRQLNWT